MNLSGVLPLLTESPPYQRLLAELKTAPQGERPVPVLRSARPLIVAALSRDLNRPILYVAARTDRAQLLHETLRAYLGDAPTLLRFPEPAALFYERAPWAGEVTSERLHTLTWLSHPPAGSLIVVASARALMFHTLPPRNLTLGTRSLKPGQSFELDQLLTTWVGLGYEATTTVLSPGEFSRRGGIVDIWPQSSPSPVRIELFGDEIESLRQFDPVTQRSREVCESMTVAPASEALARYGPHAAETLRGWDLSRLPDDLEAQFEKDRVALAAGTPFRGIEFYLPLLHSPPASLLDYLPPDAWIVLDDAGEIGDTWSEFEEQAVELRHNADDAGTLPPDFPIPYVTWDEWREELAHRGILSLSEEISYEEETPGPGPPRSAAEVFEEARRHSPLTNTPTHQLPLATGPRFGGQLKSFMDHIAQIRQMGDAAVVVSRQAQRLSELWAQRDHMRHPVAELTELPAPRSLIFVQGALDDGWVLHGVRAGTDELWSLHVLTDGEIFGWARPQPAQTTAPARDHARSVLRRHAAGRLRGPHRARHRRLSGAGQAHDRRHRARIPAGRVRRRRQAVRADPPGRPAEQVHRRRGSRRPHSTGWAPPNGSTSKKRTAGRGRGGARVAGAVCRARTGAGHAFSPDTPWQAELEASFPYVETEDQLRAIHEVKADMESSRPMDRLICGDVGYGKTEVALRAAFKAVQDGKQVAVLVPTTVLAQQHFNTFSARLAPFPVTVEMLVALPLADESRTRSSTGCARAGGHRHRHAPPAAARRGLQGPGPADHRRGAALRRDAQGDSSSSCAPKWTC